MRGTTLETEACDDVCNHPQKDTRSAHLAAAAAAHVYGLRLDRRLLHELPRRRLDARHHTPAASRRRARIVRVPANDRLHRGRLGRAGGGSGRQAPDRRRLGAIQRPCGGGRASGPRHQGVSEGAAGADRHGPARARAGQCHDGEPHGHGRGRPRAPLAQSRAGGGGAQQNKPAAPALVELTRLRA